MIRQIPRRGILAAGPLVLVGCGPESPYFGSVTPPARQRLVYANGNEPDAFDPGTYAGGTEMRIINALFDGLTKFHPVTLEPMAALATHFETNSEATRFTFYLRGHPHPRGIRFPNTDDLPEEFSRGHKAPLDGIPARWSDGALITAKDFVYSWRRVVDPKTGSADANYFYYIQNAEQIHKGKRDPEDLGVRAVDDFTFEVILRSPAVHFLALQAQRCFFAVPSHAVARALEWGRVVSGAFRLKEWRPYQRVVLVRNPRYYEAEVVQLEELVFLPVRHSLLVNLYKSGDAHVTDGNFMGPPFAGALRNRTDYWTTPALDRGDYAINVRAAPFDNVLMRYALNMATDKQAIVKALEAGQRPAIGCVPSMKGYEPVTSLPVDVDGISFDVLRYDPEGARSLMIKAGFPSRSGKRMTIDLTFEGSPGVTEILQQQWRTNLNIEVKLQRLEFVVWIRTSLDLSYRGVILGGWTAKYTDPATFLDLFQNGSVQSGTGWSDAKFDALLASADRSPNLAIRMQRLAECERFLLAAMPLIPLYFQTYSSLLKPYVRGWSFNPLDEHHFKYVWINQNWRPS